MLDLLLVDDSELDVLLTRLAFEDALVCRLHVVHDGDEALAFLRRLPPFEQAPRPRAVLLDMNMPRLSGLEVLQALRAEAGMHDVLVIAQLGSDYDADVWRAGSVQPDAYAHKPVTPEVVLALLAGGRPAP